MPLSDKNVSGGSGCKKMLNSSVHFECDLNKNTSLGWLLALSGAPGEAIEANLESHITSLGSLKTSAKYFIFYILECGFRELMYLDLIQVFE